MNKIKPVKIILSEGFTLIEILVALVLLSMTLLLLFSSLFTANKYWKIGENKIEKNEEFRLVSHFIRKQITETFPILWLEGNEKKLLFQGKRDELLFVSTLPSHRGGGGIYLLRLKVIEVDDNNQLGMSYSFVSPDADPFAEDSNEEFVTIVNNVDSINLSYFGKEKNGENSGWFETWENDTFLPQLVRIKINALDEKVNWPGIEIPIKANRINGLSEFKIRAISAT